MSVTRFPIRAREIARLELIKLFPMPPFPPPVAMINFASGDWVALSKIWLTAFDSASLRQLKLLYKGLVPDSRLKAE